MNGGMRIAMEPPEPGRAFQFQGIEHGGADVSFFVRPGTALDKEKRRDNQLPFQGAGRFGLRAAMRGRRTIGP